MALDDTKTLAERILRLEQKLQRLEKREGRPPVELFDNSAIRNRKIIDDLLVHNHTHANLLGLDADDHTQYLLTTGKAKDSDKLDGYDSTSFGRPVFLTTPKTSTDWDGDTKTTSNRAIVDLSTVFGVPAGIKAVLMSIQTQADAVDDYIRFGPNSTYNYALICRTPVASQIAHAMGIVPCDSNGDVYCYPSGTIENVYVYIWGYWL